MNSRVLLNIVLLIVALLLAALAYFRPGLEPPAGAQPLTALTPAQIGRVAIRRPGREQIVLERHDDGWRLSAPLSARANSFRLDTLLQVAQTQVHGGFAVQGRDLAEYHLQEPAAELQLDDVTITFGDTEPLNRYRYVRIADRVSLISDPYYQVFVDPVALVSLQLLPPDARLEAIRLPDVVLQQRSDGVWQSAGSKPWDADRIASLVEAWQHAQALRVSRYQGDATLPRMQLRFQDGAALEFEIVSDEDELVLGEPRSGLRYHFGATQAEQLLGRTAEPLAADDGSGATAAAALRQ